MGADISQATMRQARYALDVDVAGEYADMGVEMCEDPGVSRRWPALTAQLEQAPFDSALRADCGRKLARLIVEEGTP